MKKYSSAAITKTGRRHNNQDNYLLSGKYAECDHDVFTCQYDGRSDVPFFAAVCDGMGGEASGERASYEACAELAGIQNKLTKDFSANKSIVREAILNANTRLCDIMREEQTGRMGSTVISVLIQGDTLFYTNLGDSRIYLLRDGKLIQITKDHTEGQSMVDAGILTPEQLSNHPSRNKLNRHLGIYPEEIMLECPVYEDLALKPGDKLLLCSDGVFGVFDNEAIASILLERTTPAERAQKLVDTAYANGSKDNMTAMVIDIEKAGADYMPIIYGAGALFLAILLFFAVKSISVPKPDDSTPNRELTNDDTFDTTKSDSVDSDEGPETDPTSDVTTGQPDTPGSEDTSDSPQTNDESNETDDPPSTAEPEPETDPDPDSNNSEGSTPDTDGKSDVDQNPVTKGADSDPNSEDLSSETTKSAEDMPTPPASTEIQTPQDPSNLKE